MITALKNFLQKEQLYFPKAKYLLAVSGGIDSMVMAFLFKELELNIGIAHCNFQLRASASDMDEILVEETAFVWNIPFHSIRFDTKTESKKTKKSIELTARDLRYEWFETLINKFDYQYLCTAHHLNDSLETLLFNLAKGTGIRGLHGIPIKNKHIIRPLSFASRQDIFKYAQQHNIPFREDATNLETDHHRNLIRNKVIPPLKQINPSLENTFAMSLHHFKEVEVLFNWAIQSKKQQLTTIVNDKLHISIPTLLQEAAKATILYEILYKYGFNNTQTTQILQAIEHIGAQFFSKTHQLLIDRTQLILSPIDLNKQLNKTFHTIPNQITIFDKTLYFEELPYVPANLNQGTATAYFDRDKIQFPLNIRNWQAGDRFQPLGMHGKSKKIKAYLRDQKVNRINKEKVLVLSFNHKIAWLINYRTDERFKVDSNTKRVLRLYLKT